MMTNGASSTEHGRPLGYMESRMHLMHELLRGSTQGVVALRVRGRLEPTRFVRAVERVVNAHALLRSVIVDRGSQLVLECRARQELPVRVLARESTEHWQQVLRSEVESVLDATRSLFRITLLSDTVSETAESDIVLAVHHAIMDGAAVDHFFDQILTTASEDSPKPLRQRGLPAPAELSIPRRMRLGWNEFCASQRATAQKNAAERPRHLGHAPLEQRRTSTQLLSIDAPDLTRIEAGCEGRSITFNSLASAALVSAVHRESPGRERVLLNSTFSLRRLCDGIEPDDLGCYMSIIPTLHEFGKSPSLYELATQHHAALSAAILQNARCPTDVPLAELREQTNALRDTREFVQDVGLTYGESSLASHYGALSTVHMYATVNRSVGTLSVVVHGVKLNGRAFFTVNHTDPLQSPTWAERVAHEFSNLFLQASRETA